jgi:hypothetical protein
VGGCPRIKRAKTIISIKVMIEPMPACMGTSPFAEDVAGATEGTFSVCAVFMGLLFLKNNLQFSYRTNG